MDLIFLLVVLGFMVLAFRWMDYDPRDAAERRQQKYEHKERMAEINARRKPKGSVTEQILNRQQPMYYTETRTYKPKDESATPPDKNP